MGNSGDFTLLIGVMTHSIYNDRWDPHLELPMEWQSPRYMSFVRGKAWKMDVAGLRGSSP